MPALAAVFEAQNESRLSRWLGECYKGGEKVERRGTLRIFKPPPQSGPCLVKKGGLIFGGYGICVLTTTIANRFLYGQCGLGSH